MHVNEISKALGNERRLVYYHLYILEEHGFVSSELKMSELPDLKGRAIRIFRLSDKAIEALSGIKNKF